MIDRELPVAQAGDVFDGDRLTDPELALAYRNVLDELVGVGIEAYLAA